MSLIENYSERILLNRNYFVSNMPIKFNEYYLRYKKNFAKTIDQNVFDNEDKSELNICLKDLYSTTLSETIYSPRGEITPRILDWITLDDGKIDIDEAQMLEYTKELWGAHNFLEDIKDNITPFMYSIFLGHVYFTIRIRTIKEFANNINSESKDTHRLFKNYGFNLFKYLEKNFHYDKGITVKYTMIYEFLLKKNLINCYFDEYRNFILEKRSEDLKGIKFARKADTTGKDTSVLTENYHTFKNKS